MGSGQAKTTMTIQQWQENNQVANKMQDLYTQFEKQQIDHMSNSRKAIIARRLSDKKKPRHHRKATNVTAVVQGLTDLEQAQDTAKLANRQGFF